MLNGILPEFSEQSGVGVHYTNHSLRATAITCMYNCRVPEETTSVTEFKEMVSDDKPVTNSSGLIANPSVGAFS